MLSMKFFAFILINLALFHFSTYAQSDSSETSILQDTTFNKFSSFKELKAVRKAIEIKNKKLISKYFNMPNPKGWYFHFRVGYGYPVLTQRFEAPSNFSFLGTSNFFEDKDGNISSKPSYLTVGSGFKGGFGVGKMFNPYVGFEIFFQYNNYRQTRLIEINRFNRYESTLDASAIDMNLMPQIVLSSSNFRNLYLYTKIGLLIPFYGYSNLDIHIEDKSGELITGILKTLPGIAPALGELLEGFEAQGLTPEEVIEETINGILELFGVNNPDFILGYQATLDASARGNFLGGESNWETLKRAINFTFAIGGKYQITPVVGLNMEARYSGFNISLANVRSESISLVAEPLLIDLIVQQLGDELSSIIDIDYVNELDENSNNPVTNPQGYNSNETREELPIRFTTSAISVNFGIEITIPNKEQRVTNKLDRK